MKMIVAQFHLPKYGHFLLSFGHVIKLLSFINVLN